jgi:hypothetical protein
MPAEPVVVTVTFAEHVGSNLIISEVTDPADVSNAKFVEIYNAGGASIDLSAGNGICRARPTAATGPAWR